MRKQYNAIVIGLGGMGSAALYQLAKRGLNVLGIEQYEAPHSLGSSHGLTRIIRLAYYEDQSYVPLLRRAYELWAEVEGEFGERLFLSDGQHRYGTGRMGRSSAAAWVAAWTTTWRMKCSTARGCARVSPVIACRRRRWRFFSRRAACWFRSAASARMWNWQRRMARRSIAASVCWAGIYLADERVAVRTDAGRYIAEKLVICGGAWASKLIPRLAGCAVPERQVLIWLAPRRAGLVSVSERFPVWNGEVEEGRFYGLPEFNPSGTTPGMKLGRYHHLAEVCDPDTVDRSVGPADEAMLRGFAQRYFPDGAGTDVGYGCLHVHQYA